MRAARFHYLNHACYNGLWRVNKAGHMNTPYGGRARPYTPDVDGLRDCHRWLSGADVSLTQGGWRDALDGLDRAAFVYLDPPYPGTGTRYTRSGFDWAMQEAVRDACRQLRGRGVRFLASNADTPEIRALYEGS